MSKDAVVLLNEKLQKVNAPPAAFTVTRFNLRVHVIAGYVVSTDVLGVPYRGKQCNTKDSALRSCAEACLGLNTYHIVDCRLENWRTVSPVNDHRTYYITSDENIEKELIDRGRFEGLNVVYARCCDAQIITTVMERWWSEDVPPIAVYTGSDIVRNYIAELMNDKVRENGEIIKFVPFVLGTN
jgi:hypothetical protein